MATPLVVERPRPLPLTAAMHFFLMLGIDPPVRLPGGLVLAQLQDVARSAAVCQAWSIYGATLCAEGEANGFVPWALYRRRPRGDGAQRWQQAFIHAHQS